MKESQTYTIHLKQFEGPFDLLLFFIRRDEIDIHDIPIAKITDDFLAHIRQMEELNIELASEFIVVAATLMRIKAKMLLPRQPIDEDGQEIDPREELVRRLVEYKRFKLVIEDLRLMEDRRAKLHRRGNVLDELQIHAQQALVDIELENLSLINLFSAFQRVITQQKDRKRVVHTIVRYDYRIRDQQVNICRKIRAVGRPSFDELFEEMENRIHAIVNFLALLELANQYVIRVVQGTEKNEFWIEAGDAFSRREELFAHDEEEE